MNMTDKEKIEACKIFLDRIDKFNLDEFSSGDFWDDYDEYGECDGVEMLNQIEYLQSFIKRLQNEAWHLKVDITD